MHTASTPSSKPTMANSALLNFLESAAVSPNIRTISENDLRKMLEDSNVSQEDADRILAARKRNNPELLRDLFGKVSTGIIVWSP